ncbi:MAG: DUF47 domain-containing protein [Deltaproteobacteria bacterium]
MVIFPKDDTFFNLFVQSANKVYEAAVLLKEIVAEPSQSLEEKVNKMKQIEEEGDENTHIILSQLNKSFITPLDREDIYQIAKEIDEILDYIEDTAHSIFIFGIKNSKQEAITITELIITAAKEIQYMTEALKDTKNTKQLYKKIVEINRIENEGDTIYREAVTKLFAEETKPIEIIKWKEIFEFLENTLDSCEDLANTIEGVVMKHA